MRRIITIYKLHFILHFKTSCILIFIICILIFYYNFGNSFLVFHSPKCRA